MTRDASESDEPEAIVAEAGHILMISGHEPKCRQCDIDRSGRIVGLRVFRYRRSQRLAA
ncbi:hypothetical protein [Roseovarius sp.]|uniref:hypothetical protein n=1 Tax=Roseovarius sp. TaxID=1486281 RepID=UPI0035663B13